MARSSFDTQFLSELRRHMSGRAPDEQQIAAICAPDGPVLVDAGPGAGKTTALTWRIVYLLHARKVAPNQVFVVTFTRNAAGELKERLSRILSGAPAVHISTLHSLAWHFLRRAAGNSKWKLLEDNEKGAKIRELLTRQKIEFNDDTPEQVLTEISCVRNRMVSFDSYTPESVPKHVFRRVAQAYDSWKRAHSLLDYDDVFTRLLEILKKAPGMFRGEVGHLLVDEFQDTSLLQYELLKRLVGPRQNFCVVGDVDQSIYSWRGADPAVMLGFPRDYPDSARLELHRNYRATQTLVEITNLLIRHNVNRFEKTLQAARGTGPRPKVIYPANDHLEAKAIVDELEALKVKDRIPWSEMAIVYRRNYQGVAFLAELQERTIPFRILGEPPNPFRHAVGRDLVGYLRLACGERNAEWLTRLLNRPNRGIPDGASKEAAKRFARGQGLISAFAGLGLSPEQLRAVRRLDADLRRLKVMRPAQAIEHIWSEMNYQQYAQSLSPSERQTLTEPYAMFALVRFLAARYQTVDEFLAFAANLEIKARGWWKEIAPRQVPDLNTSRDALTLTTCHSAKGLEFDAVAVVGLVEGVLPGDLDDLEEERRLAYMAMTRARTHLLLSAPLVVYGRQQSPSRFLQECGFRIGIVTSPPARRIGNTGTAGYVRDFSGTHSHPKTPATSSGGATVPRRLEPLAVHRESRRSANNTPSSAVTTTRHLDLKSPQFAKGDRIRHLSFGHGTVIEVDFRQGILNVAFDSGEIKKLSLAKCLELGNLEHLGR